MKYKFTCNLCDYATDIKCNYALHEKSKKHKDRIALELNNIQKIENKPQNKLICSDCNGTFMRQSGLNKHLKSCQTRKDRIDKELSNNALNEAKNALNEAKNASNEATIELLRNQLETMTKIAQNTSEANMVSSNAISYIMKHFKNSPAIHTFYDHKLLGDDALSIAETAIYKHTKKECHIYIGDILIKEYKKENPIDQTIWTSDVARLAYFVREIINTEIEWSVDKAGIKTSKYLIQPVLTYIKEVAETYIKDLVHQINDNNNKQIAEKMRDGAELISYIEHGLLNKDILKYLAPYFQLNKTKQIQYVQLIQ